MSSSGRTRKRRKGPAARATGAPIRRETAPWRRALDQWGGIPMIAALAVSVSLIVTFVVVASRGGDGGSTRGGEFVPIERGVTNGRIEGDPAAPVRIVEYADFSCPHCRDFATGTHRQLLDEYVEPGLASIEYRYVAFLGEGSYMAAEAAECALDQGAFWHMHDLLFLRQSGGAFSESRVKDYARELADHRAGFDVSAFDSCIGSGQHRATVEAQMAEARDLGVTSTPTFTVNGEVMRGAVPIDAFREAIDRHLGR